MEDETRYFKGQGSCTIGVRNLKIQSAGSASGFASMLEVGYYALKENMREALSVCNRYVSLFHCFTAKDLIWFLCWFVCGVCVFFLGGFVCFCLFLLIRDLLVLTAVG